MCETDATPTKEQHNFCMNDKKGRSLGAVVYRRGNEVMIWATRNNEPFGAIQPWQSFASGEDADKAINKRLIDMRKRYFKIAASTDE